ncbi:hypothetical protein A3H85_02695 [Candidatus Daviesbacteria bacterium RIFCSPLOWO2_02_FULL_40_8]|uniref:Uncharacterized protein n=1 Tax=Candidatus Daviesbacteria bacterium RIFCSPLOWO2_01_FULL_40_24 TaxID=1797787 RepID=A0A1F5MIM5_9BACT|nr:MAG: hypothetical protein A2780_03420 [Candidatus Daviesbacteria bacterium RIFCSPHIGHO2_01_FULL_41_45]OGE34195.1 MAG: hypothetical protein A3C32_00505 [Candidatus Daviesbacteria bacterium RIFCSPHIGHO2_02_FULL_41_14]OGE65179.1 MAG: hypothetical protein A3B49_01455 [Candidatus Daviesbacteria bacterium RIFCSPLOWO2_01_FULL_40_24]OGE66882.1 MAG: hypothetical protein A3H85_02695 [Candidatus Daviesbacteria bacterium RIFCSPLOWO2_02_FULL_40_8]
MSAIESRGCFEVRFPKIPTITSIRLFAGSESRLANCFLADQKAFMVVSDPIPTETSSEDQETTYRRLFEEDRPTIELLQFGHFCAQRAIEITDPQGQLIRVIDYRDQASFELMTGQFNRVLTSPPVFRIRDGVNQSIQATIFSDVKHTSQERLQVERAISYYNDVVSLEESPYPNHFKNDPDSIRDEVIPNSPAELVDHLLETMYNRETFDPNYFLAAIRLLRRLTAGVSFLDIERLYRYPPGKNVSLENILFLGSFEAVAHGILQDVLLRPPEQRFCELDALRIATVQKMSKQAGFKMNAHGGYSQ